MTTCNGKINELIDSKNRLYKVPNFCINLPFLEKFILVEEEEHNNKKLNIFLNDVYENKKVDIEITDDFKIIDIKKKYAENNSVDLDKVKLRFLYGGSELNDDNFIYQYNICNGYIIQILKINLSEVKSSSIGPAPIMWWAQESGFIFDLGCGKFFYFNKNGA